MKKLVFFMLILGMGVSLFAQVNLPEHHFASGNWGFIGSRLYQNDANERLAKLNIRIPQNGPMIYEFNARYEDGIMDGQGGFGIHIFTSDIYHRASWGSGVSYLLWLNYDENPVTPGIQKGLSAQVYRSYSSAGMELLQSIDLNSYFPYCTMENLANPVPFRIWVNGNTGEIRVYDPTDPNMQNYYYFYAPADSLPLKGDWISLRTNGMELSFGMGLR